MNTNPFVRMHKRVVALFVLAFAIMAAQADFNPDGWSKQAKIRFAGYNPPGGATTLTNFPVLVVLSTDITDFDYNDFLSPPNLDLRFTAANGTDELNYEIETWDAGGNSYVWVQVPELVDANTYIWAWWGRAGLASPPSYTSNGDTWSNAYRAVWHMNQDPSGSAPQITDSTANGLHGTTAGSMTSGDSVPAMAGNGLDFDGSNDYVSRALGAVNAPFTVHTWCYFGHLNQPNTDYDYVAQLGTFPNSMTIARNHNSDNRYYTHSGGSAKFGPVLAGQQWLHIVSVFDTSAPYHRVYVNGEEKSVDAVTAAINTSGALYLGVYNGSPQNHWLNGKLDEFRVSTVARSSNWVWATWLNTASNGVFSGSFNLYEAVEPYQSANPVVENGSALNPGTNSVSLVCTLVSTGASPTTVFAFWATTDYTTNEADWVANGSSSNLGQRVEGETFTNTVTDLDDDTLYYYNFMASNTASKTWGATSSSPSFETRPIPLVRYVTPTGAGTFSGADWGNAYSNVQDAVTASAGQVSEIYLQSGIYTNTSQLVISNHPGLTLMGGYVGSGTPGDTGSAPTILTRGTATTNRIVFGYGSVFTLNNLTISNGWGLVTDGSSFARGGGLYLTNCTVTLTNCVLTKNRLPGGSFEEGGGIYAVVSALNIQGGRLSDNGVAYHGDGNTRDCYGGAIRAVNSTSVFDNVVFERNLGGCYNYSYGQCLYITGGRLTARGCQFTGNRSGGATAEAHVNGLFQFASLQALSISNCVFTTNYHNGAAGLIYVTGTANGLEMVDTTLNLNEEVGGYGILAVEMSGGSFAVRNCVFSGNKNVGIYKAGNGSLSITNCLITGQQYHAIRSVAGTLSIANSTLTENLQWGVTNAGATVTMKDTIVWNNTGGGVGGTVSATYCNSQNALAGTSNLSANPLFVPPFYHLAAAALQGGSDSPCINTGSDLASNLGLGSAPWTTRTDGGVDSGQVDMGYHYTNGTGSAVIYLTLYVDAVNGNDGNTGDDQGLPLKTITTALGKISSGGTIHVAAGTYNTALGETLPLVLGQNNLSIIGTNRQSTVINGGGVSRLLEASSKGNVWLQGMTFTNGTHASQGGALYFDTCLTTITNCVLARNGRFDGGNIYGGAIYAFGGHLTVLNSELTGNGSPFFVDGSSAQGGAIWANGTAVTLDHCLFRTNAVSGRAYGGGGCLYLSGGSATIRNSQFADNYSRSLHTGPGVLYLNAQTALSISNCIFYGNTMYGYNDGGGVVTVDGTASGVGMVGCTFTNNTVTNAAGGMVQVNKSSGSMSIRDTIIGRNSGNGVWLAGAGTLGVTNSLIHSQTNHGVLVTAGTASLSSLTIANNGRWGVTNSAGTVTVKNSIVWGNTLGGITNATVSYTDSQEVNAGTGNLNTDPRFNDPGLFDFSLKSSSPCVNAGDNEDWMETSLDLAGANRRISARVDMGAYESSGARGSIFMVR